ncbi:hypothetical protein PR002_g22553 [Phytophthora rubi]|uniref:Uncharacterized protein n=1 Tax=Phytophthora rubi TaxID=129364 RepID=A0A6A3IZL1_9STRA|nr:hypothetical protein PR002_g22553 [Phytophthora rubi]
MILVLVVVFSEAAPYWPRSRRSWWTPLVLLLRHLLLLSVNVAQVEAPAELELHLVSLARA